MLSYKDKEHYYKYTMHHGARWIASVMKVRECSDPQVVIDLHMEAMMKVFERMYKDRTKGMTQEIEVSQWDLINSIRLLGGTKAYQRQYYEDDIDVAPYELNSKSGKYTLCLEIRYDERVRSIWFSLRGMLCFWSIPNIFMSAEQFEYLIKDFVEFMDELAIVSYKALEKAKKLLLLEDIETITKEYTNKESTTLIQ